MNPLESVTEAPQEAILLGKKYLQKTEAYYKLKFFQQLTTSKSAFSKLLIIGGFLFIGFVFIAIAGAIVLGKMLGSMEYGFLLIALTLFILGFIAYKLRYIIENRVIQTTSKRFFK